VTGNVFVLFKGSSKFSSVRISGTIKGATSGQVAELFASQFPFKSGFQQVGSAVMLQTTGTNAYSFTATPGLATSYEVEVLASAGSTTPLAT
jgi:hypothetical protein